MRTFISFLLLCPITFSPLKARSADDLEGRLRPSAIAKALEERLYIKNETLRIVFPPSETIKSGDVVRFDNVGALEEVTTLPSSAYQSNSTHLPGEYQEMRRDPDLKLAKSLLNFESPSHVEATVTYFVDGLSVERFESRGVAQDETLPERKVPFLTVPEESRELGRQSAVDNALLNSAEAKTAFGRGTKLCLVTTVVRGRVVMDIDFGQHLPTKIHQKGDTYFLADHPPRPSTVRLVSHLPLAVAFQVEAIEFVPNPMNVAQFIGVKRTVSKLTPSDLGQWDKAPRAYGAAQEPVAHVVTVHYATDRARNADWDYYYHNFWRQRDTGFCILAVTLIVIVGVPMLIPRATRRYGVALILLAILLAAGLWFVGCKSASVKVDEDLKQGFVAYSGNDANRLEYGTVQVTVPINRAVGSIPTPFSVLTFMLPSDPSKHFTLADVEPSTDDAFFTTLKERIGRSKRKQAFIFIHGYNTTFEDAAFRTAQLWYDLAFEGAPLLYSWPSQGAVFDYTIDEQQADRTTARFEAFLKDVVARSGAEQVHLIAHSMGNRVVANSLESIGKQNSLGTYGGILGELVMAAPDVDPERFTQQLGYVAKLVQRVTLYASINDIPLNYSRKIHGDSRLGFGGPSIFLDESVNSIDASELRTDRDSHGYVMSNDIVLGDMHQLVVNGLAPNQRFGLIEKSISRNGHILSCWEFRTRDR